MGWESGVSSTPLHHFITEISIAGEKWNCQNTSSVLVDCVICWPGASEIHEWRRTRDNVEVSKVCGCILWGWWEIWVHDFFAHGYKSVLRQFNSDKTFNFNREGIHSKGGTAIRWKNEDIEVFPEKGGTQSHTDMPRWLKKFCRNFGRMHINIISWEEKGYRKRKAGADWTTNGEEKFSRPGKEIGSNKC